MTCPTCQLHAGLLTSGEYEDQNDRCLSNDAVLKSREFMIERSRAQIKGGSDGNRAYENRVRPVVLHSIRGGGMAPERLATVGALSPMAHVVDVITGRFEALAEDIEHGQSPDWSLFYMRRLLDDARQQAGLGVHPWRGRLKALTLTHGLQMQAAE